MTVLVLVLLPIALLVGVVALICLALLALGSRTHFEAGVRPWPGQRAPARRSGPELMPWLQQSHPEWN